MLPYIQTGSGDTTLVFLHYFGGSARSWRHVTERLAPSYCCCAVDMPGFGDAADYAGYSVQQMSDAVREVIASLAPEAVVLIGHSMGGKVAMVLAANPPSNLQHAILVAPSPLVPEPMTEEQRATMTVANQSVESATKFVENGALALPPDALKTGVDDVFRANDEAWKAWPQGGTKEVWTDRVQSFSIRTDLIVGSEDKVIPLDFQKEHTFPLVDASGGCLTVLQQKAHLLPYEDPAGLADAIAAWCAAAQAPRT